ncbi:branched-chain amino acid ABC transporter permease [Bradyrhizobium sp. STM 3561]|uniref:branched-chain amino acid ABC transporter permease n=1 Tax=unclassified Bradyrhizobium TaxID=2631580 RepID=UPI00388F8D6E
MSQFLQFVSSGLTVGAIYALAALGFSIIYNASGVINFAQGEFMMMGGIVGAFLTAAGIPLPLAALLSVLVIALVGLLVEKLVVEPASGADVVSLIIITLGVAMILRGIIQVTFGKANHSLPAFSGDKPIAVFGATILPQSIWILCVSAVLVVGLGVFFGRTRIGKGMLAAAYNRLAAELVGIDTRTVLMLSFVLSAAIGAIGGILVAPIATTSYDSGGMLGLKGFVAATLGGLGSGAGAVLGGLLLGLLEAMTAGYASSAYKDAVSFVLALLILGLRPQGLLGARQTDRV